MQKRPTHKMVRRMTSSSEFYLCTLKRADFAENLAYHWSKVSCSKCLALRKVK
jgi:hypothetical protein